MMPVVITPLVTLLVAGLAMYPLLGAPLAWVKDHPAGLADLHVCGSALLLGLILGAMMASDLRPHQQGCFYPFATAGLSSGRP